MHRKSNANVMVSIGSKVSVATRNTIENFVNRQIGVSRASHSRYVPQVMMVEYDPRQITATTLVNSMRCQGVNAQLVGF